MTKKIILIILLIAIILLAYFGYPIIKKRYFESSSATKKIEIKPRSDITTDETAKPDSETGSSTDDGDADESKDAGEDLFEDGTVMDETNESGDHSDITAEDCDNGCKSFENNPADLRYCKDICGLSEGRTGENCADLSGQDKDYCFKNQAISQSKINICNSITDQKIKSSCKNRVTEDLLENPPKE